MRLVVRKLTRMAAADGTVDDDEDNPAWIETPPYERAQQHCPRHRRLTVCLAIVEQFPMTVGADAVGRRARPVWTLDGPDYAR